MNAEAVHRIVRRCYRLVVVVLTCTVLACDTDVDRFTDRSGGVAFNLTGVITTESDTQFVRVQRIREEIVQTSADPLNADVTLTDLDTGESRRLLDSLVVLDNGERDHLFFTPYVVTAGHRYQLMVEGVDGDVATATTTVPDRPSTTVVRADIFGSLITQSVSWNALTRTPEHAVVTYEIARSQGDDPSIVEIPYTLRGRLARSGWTAVVRLSDDQRIARQELEIRQDDNEAVFLGISMRLRLPSAEWAQSDNPQNISGGLGFFGSVGIFTERWIVDSETVDLLGFINGQQQ